jgi:hypothetical protein
MWEIIMNKLFLIPILLLSLISTPCFSEGGYKEGWAAYIRGDYPTAMKLYRKGAEEGEQKAQYNLGVMYENGVGISEPNKEEAVKWFRKAVEKGDVQVRADASHALRWLYKKGLTSKDYSIKKGSILGSKNSLKLTPMSSSQLTPIQIFNYFPLCKIRSSLGPSCKSYSPEESNKFSPSTPGDFVATIKRNKLEIHEDDWYYSFSLEREGDGKYSLRFTDDALTASYLVSNTFYLIWEEKIHNWTIVGERLNYIQGSDDEKEAEGKYESFDEPIPFLSSK